MVNSSKPYVEGMNAITQASQGKQLSGIEFTNGRDLLIYKFSIATGTCTGVLNNALVENYETCHSDYSRKIILIPKLKDPRTGLPCWGYIRNLNV